jgi:hypothetical protein
MSEWVGGWLDIPLAPQPWIVFEIFLDKWVSSHCPCQNWSNESVEKHSKMFPFLSHSKIFQLTHTELESSVILVISKSNSRWRILGLASAASPHINKNASRTASIIHRTLPMQLDQASLATAKDWVNHKVMFHGMRDVGSRMHCAPR